MESVRTVRYRVLPVSKRKHDKMVAHIDASRFMWNATIERLNTQYDKEGKCDYHWGGFSKHITTLRKENDWLKETSSHNTRRCLKNITTQYSKFFKEIKQGKRSGLPDFKSKRDTDSFYLAHKGTFTIDGSGLYIQKIGWVKLRGNNPYSKGEAVSGVVKRENDKWYAYIQYKGVEVKQCGTGTVGIDRNVGNIALSNGAVILAPSLTYLNNKIARYNRVLARKPSSAKGKPKSRQYLYTLRKLRGVYEKRKFVIANWCHQVSRKIANEHGVAVVEDLQIQPMTASGGAYKKRLNRSVLESGWGRLVQMLSYKMEVETVPAHYTSQECSECGWVDKKNRSGRQFLCTSCGHKEHADVNAAINIQARGVRAVSPKETVGVEVGAWAHL